MDWVAAQAKRIASNRTTGVALVTRRELQFGAWGLNAECVVRCSLVIDDKSALSDCRCSDSHPDSGGFGISRKPGLLPCQQVLPIILWSEVFQVAH